MPIKEVKLIVNKDGKVSALEMTNPIPSNLTIPLFEWELYSQNNDNQIVNGEFVPNHVPDRTYWLDGKEYVLKHPDVLPEGATFEKPSDISAQEERALRDELLRASDWAVLPDAPLTAEQKLEWQVYRQALRDIPQQSGFPEFVIVPEAPVKVVG